MGLKGWLTKRKAKKLQKESQRQALQERGQTEDVLPQDHLNDPIQPIPQDLLPPAPKPVKERPYKAKKTLGEGAFGKVDLWTSPGKESVVKKTAKGGEQGRKALQKESEVMDTLGEHPNIVQKSNVDTGGDGLTMEALGGGDMQKMFDSLEDDYRKGKISHTQYWGSIQHLTKGTLEGVKHMGEKGLVHGDLKPGNVMLDDKANPKLIDFGSSTEVGGNLGSQTTLINTAPETYDFSIPKEERTGAHKNNDVYAVGQMMHRMGEGMKKTDDGEGSYGHLPEGKYGEYKTRLHRGKLHEEGKGGTLENTEGKGAYGRFVNRTTETDPDKRFSAKEALKMQFMKDPLMQEEDAKQFLQSRISESKTAPPPAPIAPQMAPVTATKGDRDNKYDMQKELLKQTAKKRKKLDKEARKVRKNVEKRLKKDDLVRTDLQGEDESL